MTNVRYGIFAFCGLFIVILGTNPAQAGCEELHNAIKNANYGTIDQELSWGTSINCINANGDAPLHTAVYTLNSSLVGYILGRGAFVNVRDKTNATPLTVALDGYEFVYDDELDALDAVITVLKNAGGVDK